MKKKMRMEERKAGVMPWSRGEQEDLVHRGGLDLRQEHSRSALEMVGEQSPQPRLG